MTAAAAVLSAAGVLITLAVPGKPHKAGAIAPARPAIRTGTVTGHLTACIGPYVTPGRPSPVDPGTVTVVRGRASNSRQSIISNSGQSSILPGEPAVARVHIGNNYHQLFRFSLPPGTYVLIGRYDGASPSNDLHQVSVIAGKTLHADLPDDCQ